MLIKTNKSDAVLNFLRQKFLVNENIIGIIENVPNAEIYVDDVNKPKGALVKKNDYMHYVFTEDDDFVEELCKSYFQEGFFGFSGVEGSLAEKIRQRYQLGWESRCTLYYMPKENLDMSLKKNPTEKIKLEDAPTVDKFYQYRDLETLEVIKRDITNRPSSAVYVDGEIACWVLIHDDNSMGIMYTKEEYRRKGYAIDVTIDLAHQIIEMGKIPFIQIVKGNNMSPGLAKKCGFVEAGQADWFGIIAGNPKQLAEANEDGRQQFLNAVPKEIHPMIYKENETYVGLYNYLHNFKYQSAGFENLSFEKAETEQQKEIWCQLVNQKFKCDIKISDLTDPNFNLFLLQKDNNAIAACATHRFGEEEKGLYFISVLSEYENTDILKTLIMEALNYEKNHGGFFVITQAEKENLLIFEELGFRKSHVIS